MGNKMKDKFSMSSGMNVNDWLGAFLCIKIPTKFLTYVKGKGCSCACHEGIYST
jgi:hypothetical protein